MPRSLIVYHLSWFLLCSVLTGCAALPAPPSEPARAGWGNVAVVPAGYPPASNIRTFAIGKGQGTGKGAAAGAGAGFVGLGAFAASGALEAVVAPYLAVVMVPTLAVGGALFGSQTAMSEQDAADLDQYMQRNLTSLQVPDSLARAVVDTTQSDVGLQMPLLAAAGPVAAQATPDYRGLAAHGADSVLEVVAPELGFTGGKQLRFYLKASVRVVRVSDGSQLYQRDFVYQSDEYAARQWGANQAALLRAELQRAYTSLAESVVEQVFLLTPLPQSSWAAATGKEEGLQDLLKWGRDACGLAWVSPPRDYHPTITTDIDHRDWNRFPTLDSLQPTLAWEAFPRERDRRGEAAGQLSAIRDVRYDLRVWQVAADAPPTLVYERRDLAAPTLVLEQPLTAGARYFWSARARFDLDGRTHGTKWGYFRSPGYMAGGVIKPEASPAVAVSVVAHVPSPRDPCTLDFIPTSNYYRFQVR